MSEESKISGGGGALGAPSPTSSDDRKSSIGFTAAGKKVIIKSADMEEDIQKEAVDISLAAFEKYNVEKDVAEHIKKMFDKKYGPTWHCIVGKNFVEFGIVDYMDSAVRRCFSSYVTHETNHFVYFYLDSKAVLLFKSG